MSPWRSGGESDRVYPDSYVLEHRTNVGTQDVAEPLRNVGALVCNPRAECKPESVLRRCVVWHGVLCVASHIH